MAASKFYHYRIWVEDLKNNNRVDLDKHLDGTTFNSGPHEIDGDTHKSYNIKLQSLDTGKYHGILFRGKSEDAYMRLGQSSSFSQLSSQTPDDGKAGETDSDIVDFAIVQDSDYLHVLLEVGFQTPGIGKLSQYIAQHVTYDDEYSVKRETKLGPNADDKLNSLVGTELKSMSVSFKKHPTTYSEMDDADEVFDTLTPDDYRFEFGVTLERGHKNGEDTEDALQSLMSLFGKNNQPLTNSIRQLDFPRMMYSFDIEAEDGNKEVEQNLADTTNKEEIDKSYYGFFDKKLGKKLCREIRNQI